jgi:hypothetical protein
MINFSELSANDRRIPKTKEHLLHTISKKTGVDAKYLNPLYESYSYQYNGDIDKITDKMFEYFMIANNKLNNEHDFGNDFFKALSSLEKSMDVAMDAKSYDDIFDHRPIEKNREEASKSLLSLIKKYFGITDSMTFLEIVIVILQTMQRNKSRKGKKSFSLFESTGLGQNLYNHLKTLNESYLLDFVEDNNNRLEHCPDVSATIKSDINFYNSLKMMLNDVWKRCETQELKDVYSKIVDHIEKETSYLVNKDNIITVDDSLYDNFIKDLINSPRMNIMYNNVDYLRSITADLQTLMFDLMIIVNTYVKRCENVVDYLDMTKLSNYRHATKTLFDSIASSQYSSRILTKNTQPLDYNTTATINNILYSSDFHGVGKYDHNRISMDCLMIIKAMQNEFNLKIRKFINNYISSGLELLHSLRKIETKLNNFVIDA